MIPAAVALAQAPPAPISPPPNQGIVISVAQGSQLSVGHVLVDPAALAKLGVTLSIEGRPAEGALVALVPRMTVRGLPIGERLVYDAIPTLMFFEATGDPYLDAADPAWAALRLFVDADRDAKVDPGEARSFSAAGIAWISRFGEVRPAGR